MPPTTILLIRHAEKPDASRDIRGVDIHGHDNPAELSVTGWQRSGALPRLLSPAQAAEMLPKPDVIFAGASHPRSARPVRTVELLAQTLGLPLRDSNGSDDVEELVGAVRACDGVVMVCWRHESIAVIARAFVGDTPQVPEWDAQRFDVVWVLSPSGGGWTLRQRPQLLLPGDRREPIEAS
jgi:hypothetical protein